MKKILCLGFIALAMFANAQVTSKSQITTQQRCGTPEPPQGFENWIQSLPPINNANQVGKNTQSQSSTMSVFNIPVVVHVIHNNEAVNTIGATSGGNLNAAQIQDQINILNEDYNGLNPDTANIPTVFKPYLGKFQFNFCLAVVNPTGGIMAEPGIDRVNRQTAGFTAPPWNTTYITNTIKPATIWNTSKYMNMWVCSISGGILGYATWPAQGTTGLSGIPTPSGTATSDGLVMLNTAFGSIGTAVSGAPYNLGRTAVHEIGHWLGLRHIWGDATCGNDFCNDTPPAQTSNFNCPTHPYKLGTCAGNTTGEMTMNYMDYTNDACMYMFTADQKNRAQLVMTNSPNRSPLLTSTVCNLPSIGNDIGIQYVVSPTYSQVVTCSNSITPIVKLFNYGSTTISSATLSYKVDAGATQTVAWAGSLAPSTSVNVTMPVVSNLTNGAHVYSVNIGSPNGGTDMNSSNNYNAQNFSISGSFTLSTAASPGTVCAGSSATLTGGGSATTYSWNPGAIVGANATVTPASATIYTLTGKTGTCVNTKTIQVSVNPSPTVTVNSSTLCGGGTATLTATGATTYSWNTGATTAVINPSPASLTVYTVTGTSSGCTNVKTATVTVNTSPTVTVNSATVCSGTSATLTAIGAGTYSWNTGATTAVLNPTPASTTVYTVTGTSSGCTNVKTATVTVNTTPTVTVNSATICSGTSATLTATGATTYSWNTGATTAVLNPSPVSLTVYTVTGTSAVGNCKNIKTATVTVNTSPTVTVNSSTVCAGTAATLTAIGATTYSWNTGATTAVLNPTPAALTVYTVTGTSGICTNVKTATVTVNANPTVTVNSATICSGTSATLTATGASTYSWNTGATTAVINPSPGSTTQYTITGTAANGCKNIKTSTVTVNITPTVNVSSFTVCPGGSATLTASGAATYSWNTGSTVNPLIVTPASTTAYTVTGTSAVGNCKNAKTTTVTIGSALSVNVSSSVQTICSGNSATISASGATNYTWNPGGMTGNSIIVNPAANTVYNVVGVTGACSGTNTSNVNVSANPTLTVAQNNVLCNGQANGTATMVVTGGATPYTYTWSPTGGTASTESGLAVGNYTASATTTAGCNATATFTITQPSVLNSSATYTDATCGSCADGSASALATGGAGGPYTYSWSPSGGNAATATGLLPGCYTVTVADMNNCTSTSTTCVGFVTGIKNNTSVSSFNIYPNPTTGQVSIEFGTVGERTVEVIDVTGRIIANEKTANASLQLNLSNYSNAVYYLVIKEANGVSRFKIVKQ
ncbi:MAG: hypothetical protein K0S32_2199 [Bacteroidetes bacterium]|jgi:hypothetical protein|nr:hypothetical protein [Bacteroidota bacterium]